MPPDSAQATVGHVHLKVADLDRAVDFYTQVVGMRVTARWPGAAFLAFADNHHDLGLNTWQSAGGSPPPPGTTGLFHTAFRYPTRRDLALAVRRALDAGVPLSGASDHLVSEAVYLSDPEGNGVELYRDRPCEEWDWPAGGEVRMAALPLDLGKLLSELG